MRYDGNKITASIGNLSAKNFTDFKNKNDIIHKEHGIRSMYFDGKIIIYKSRNSLQDGGVGQNRSFK